MKLPHMELFKTTFPTTPDMKNANKFQKYFFSKQCKSLEFRSFALSSSSRINMLSFTNVIFSFDFDLRAMESKGILFSNTLSP